MNEHDAVVIGAGHNGLVAACYLAAAGLDVVVVEASETIGGLSCSGRPFPNAPEHVANYCAGDLAFWSASPVGRELDLERHGLRTILSDPAYVYLHPDGASLALWRDPKKTVDEIRRFSAADADAYLEYVRFLSAVFGLARPLLTENPNRPAPRSLAAVLWTAARHRREMKGVVPFLLSSGEEAIDARFRHPVLRAALHAFGAGTGPINTPTTAMTHTLLAFMHGVDIFRPVGGMQALPNALRRRLESSGGSILTGTPVAEIVVRGNRATGVGLADGRVLHARRAVVASCDPRTALERLLPSSTLPPTIEARVRNIPTNRAGAAPMKVDLALSGRVDLSRFEKWRGDGLDLRRPCHVIGSPEGTRRSYERCGANLMPEAEDLTLWNFVPTGLDESQAPPGQDTVYLYTPSVPVRPENGWKELTQQATQAIIDRSAEFYGGITELEIGRSVLTPQDIADHKGAPDACPWHVDFELFRSGPLRPALGLGGFRTPVEGLYLGGAGSHPGGGVSGLPGRLAAREVLRARAITGTR